MWDDVPLVDFEIKNGELIKCEPRSSSRKLYPYELSKLGFRYSSFNLFFRERVVLDGSQDIHTYLWAMGMDKYDFETLVKKSHGRNYLDKYWIKNMIE